MIKVNGVVIDDSNNISSVVMNGNDIFINGKKFDLKEKIGCSCNASLNMNVSISDCTIQKLDCGKAELNQCKVGTVKGDECVVTGNVDGSVDCDILTVSGNIGGNVKANVVTARGSIYGDVKTNVFNK